MPRGRVLKRGIDVWLKAPNMLGATARDDSSPSRFPHKMQYIVLYSRTRLRLWQRGHSKRLTPCRFI